jgi:hypothetical protein
LASGLEFGFIKFIFFIIFFLPDVPQQAGEILLHHEEAAQIPPVHGLQNVLLAQAPQDCLGLVVQAPLAGPELEQALLIADSGGVAHEGAVGLRVELLAQAPRCTDKGTIRRFSYSSSSSLLPNMPKLFFAKMQTGFRKYRIQRKIN